MARVAPAWCNLWAIPQAMERLLASPKTTAVLPARLIMLALVLQGPRTGLIWDCRGGMPDPPIPRISVTKRISAAQVDEFDLAGGLTEEAGAEALEFLDGIGGEAGYLRGRDLRGRDLRGRDLRGGRGELADGGLGGGFGGVDDRHAGGHGAGDERPQQRGMGAAHDQRDRQT